MRILILFLLSIIVQSAIAQDSLSYDMSEVVIHEQRLGISFKESSRTIDIISLADIQASSADNIAELLNDIAGVDIRQRGAHGVQADVGIRGGTFDQTLILINGMKLSDPQTGHHNMNIPVAIEDIERIEVLKGPAARIYGQNGFAGAINIVTRKSEENKVALRLHAGENDLIDAGFRVSQAMKSYTHSLSYQHNQSDGYKYNTDYKITNTSYQGSLGSNGNQLNILASHGARKFGANGFYASPDFTDQYEETYASFISLDYNKLIGAWYISPKVSYRRHKDDYVFLRDDPSFFQNIHTSNILTGEVQARTSNKIGIMQVGLEYQTLDLESNNLGQRSRNSFTINAEQRILLLNEKLDITPGVSVAMISDLDTKIFPGLDIGYAITPSIKIYGNTGYTYRVPTYTDLYYSSSVEQGNDQLQPEEAISYEVGAKYINSNLTAQVALFTRRGRDLIDWSKADSLSKWQPNNIGNLATSGIETSLQYGFDDEFPIGLSNIRINYTYITTDQSDQESFLSRYALEYVRHQLSANVRYHIGDLYHNIQLRYVDRANLEDYTVVDTKLYYDLGPWSISINANNILDRTYRETNLVVMPGRWVSGGLDYRFGW